MPKLASVGISVPPYPLDQHTSMEFANEIFQDSFKDISRLLTVFHNGDIEERNFVKDLHWFKQDHTFEEKNNAYIENAISLSVRAIKNCLRSHTYVHNEIECHDIDAIFFISSTGISTPSIDAKIMNILPFSPHTKRIPIWGLGCAGGAAGLSRAFEYCLAFPTSKVLVVAVELCSLTFQKNDRSKSNLIGTSLFADGAAAILLIGDKVQTKEYFKKNTLPSIVDTQSTLMPHSEDVMGWDVRNEGLYVIFSKDIPLIIREWLKPNVEKFLKKYELSMNEIKHFIAHPGGKKVIEAYESALNLTHEMTESSRNILKKHGNISSATVYYVVDDFMKKEISDGEYGLIAALGPGFSSELLLVKWEEGA
ncbi:type III polyketide synthase [Bacillus salitolerans]|uniref:Type III polyketide synthase n=1 Tax=Bacillus salitolerans TaxID=1437434 RepID=A0ABW4LV34_9BACI